MPQNPFLVATKSSNQKVYVFDVTKHPSEPEIGVFKPQHTCEGHTQEGYGLSWSPFVTGRLASGSNDSKVLVWDVEGAGASVDPLYVWENHTDVVEDLQWHPFSPHILGSVSDDRTMILWDSRFFLFSFLCFLFFHFSLCSDGKVPIVTENIHSDDVNAISFCPQNEFLIATGSSDSMVHIWDMRDLSKPFHICEGHTDGVYGVKWSPSLEHMLISFGMDRRVNVWDLSRIGEEQDPEDAEDGPPELLFVHAGHTAKVNDASWNMEETLLISSVGEDSVLQLWHMAGDIYNENEDDEDDEDDEDEEEKSENEYDEEEVGDDKEGEEGKEEEEDDDDDLE